MTREGPSAMHQAGSARPDFVCIGAQKAGTSWLHRELRAHPELWLPATKELHYFDRAWGGRLSRHLVQRSSVGDVARRRLRGAVLDRSLAGMRLVFHQRTMANYGRLFDAADDLLSGEVTPAYALLDDEVIAEFATAVPHCKIIFILRDPVDRASAHVRMFSKRFGMAVPEWGDVPAAKQSPILRKSQYCDDLDRWQRAFGVDQVFVGFFDDLRADPASFLESVLDFLGVAADSAERSDRVAEVVHAGRPETVSEATASVLAAELLDEVERLHERFGNAATQRWLDNAHQLTGVS